MTATFKSRATGAEGEGRCIVIRFDKEVEFVIEIEPDEYDPVLGITARGAKEIKRRPCDIADLGTEKKIGLYGRTDFAAYVLIHRGSGFDCKTVKFMHEGELKSFFVQERRQLRNRATYIVSEVRPDEG